MTSKHSGALISLSSLVACLVSVGFVGCSLESNDIGQPTFSKQTYVRANPRATTRATVPRIVKARRAVAFPKATPILEKLNPKVVKAKPVVKLASKANYQGYAVAYSRLHAVVQDSSIIPFALQSKKPKELKRFTLPFFNKAKSKPKTIESEASRLERLANARSSVRVRTTAYTHNERDHVKYGRKSALGTRLRFGSVRSAAADWSRYPVGTQFRIKDKPGILYEVDDYGGALVGTGTIDLYKPTFSAMNRWGVRHVDIEVVKWGSFAESLKVLKPRTKWSHIRSMIASIQKKGATEESRLTALLMVHRPKES